MCVVITLYVTTHSYVCFRVLDMSEKDPKRGHHVINNGVRKVIPNIIDEFLKQKGKRFSDLPVKDCAPCVWRAHETPLSKQDIDKIDEMTVKTPASGKEEHNDENDQLYGKVIHQLLTAVVAYLNELFEEFNSGQSKSQQQFFIVTGLVERCNSIDNEVYVDHQALEWWCKRGGDMEVYLEVRSHVAEMFNTLANKSEILTWIAELHQIL